ncbi:juvenile hormone acid O-methyltransferase-like [Anoplolepis gracilipes]|uniref:juvenile hormone acid O-methyltransferase-like n=1 Tax=Anoplolepis gracilipes TaxID=354296 RepID=UPI003BA04FE7
MNPEKYVSFNDLQKCNVMSLIDEFDEDLIHMSGKCMDIGCGPGDITKNILLPALNPNAVMIGTDISENMIEFAKKTYGNEKLKFEVLDIQTTSLPKKYISRFDHVFSFNVLHWCYDIRQALENIYRIIRPNGNMLLMFAASQDIFEVIKILAQDNCFASYIQDVRKYISPFNDSACPRKELRKLLKSIGFEIYHCSLREMTYSSKDVNNFLFSIMSMYSFLDKMSYNQKEEFQNKFIHEFVKRQITYKTIHNNQEQTLILNLQKILIVYARKIL